PQRNPSGPLTRSRWGTELPVHETRCERFERPRRDNTSLGGVMDNIANLEISPGTITIQPCQSCGNNAYTFDTVALHDTGVAWAGTIRRCVNCEENNHD